MQKVEHQAPHRGNGFTAEQRDRESKRDKHTQTEQPREESKREQ